tara:strand:- start:212 stop:730 length:519 start_codon:yes stop_codon:yes gene_type:complete
MKIKLFSILIFLFLFVPSYSTEKIAYLDVEKIMQDSIAGKSIISQLKKKREASITKLKKKETEIFEKEKKLISQKNILSKDEFESKLKDLRNEISNYQKDRNKSVNDITNSRVKASTKLIQKLNPILEDYSKRESIKIIIQKKHIVIGKKEYDITKDILELVNQKVKKIKID